jgi:molecular chaperone DnaJ
MAAQRDYYEVLGIPRSASPEEIKAAFRKLAALHHPDKNAGDPDAAERFKEINNAYQVLKDVERRGVYDRFGHRAEQPGSPFGQNGPFAGGVVDLGDLNVDGFLGDLLGVFGVGKGDRGDIKREIEISFVEAAFGVEKEFRYQRINTCKDCTGSGAATGSEPEVCSVCAGRGRVRLQQGLFPIAVERPCAHCKGRGRIVRVPCAGCKGSGLLAVDAKLRITIPQGVDAGATKLVQGAGNRSRPDRAPGDLELTINVAADPVFRRLGDDVLCALPVTFAQATLGADVVVPTLNGSATLRVPPGTQAGSVLKLRNEGIPHRTGVGRGDLRAEVGVHVPTQLSPRAQELLIQFAAELGETVQPLERNFVKKLKNLFG